MHVRAAIRQVYEKAKLHVGITEQTQEIYWFY